MKKSNNQSLGDVIREFIQSNRLESKLNETKVINLWEKVVGEMVSKHTKYIHIRNKVLYVSIDSPSLRNELSYSREKIVQELNRLAAADVLVDLVVKG